MTLIYKNNYGSIFQITNSRNPGFEFQMVVDTVGLFMSMADLDHLLKIVTNFDGMCTCPKCGGKSDRIISSNARIDICLKVDETVLNQIEDLIRGTQFTLAMNATLSENQVVPKSS